MKGGHKWGERCGLHVLLLAGQRVNYIITHSYQTREIFPPTLVWGHLKYDFYHWILYIERSPHGLRSIKKLVPPNHHSP